MPKSDLGQAIRCFQVLLQSGMGIQKSCLVLINDPNPHVQLAFAIVSKGLDAGKTLSASMAVCPWAFSSTILAMVSAGEKTGRLTVVLERIADFLEEEDRLQKQVVSALAYPCCILALSVVLAVVICIVVVPQQAELLKSLGSELPWISRFVIGLSELARDVRAWAAGLLLALGAYFAVLKLSRDGWGETAQNLALGTPLIGPLLANLSAHKVLRVLALFLDSGLTLDKTRGAADVTPLLRYRRGYAVFLDEVRKGSSLAGAARKSEIFPGIAVSYMSIAEKQGSLPALLTRAADLVQTETENRLEVLTALLEPAAMMFLGLLVGGLVLACMLPMAQILGKL